MESKSQAVNGAPLRRQPEKPNHFLPQYPGEHRLVLLHPDAPADDVAIELGHMVCDIENALDAVEQFFEEDGEVLPTEKTELAWRLILTALRHTKRLRQIDWLKSMTCREAK